MGRKLSKICTLYSAYILVLVSLILPLSSFATEFEVTNAPSAIVMDGDSLEINHNRIRLMGIDAPEYTQLCKDEHNQKYSCGKVALNHLTSLIRGKNLHCTSKKKDKYNRYLCFCKANNVDINREMVLSGHALSYMESPYLLEQTIAHKNKRGIWKGNFMHPRLYRILLNHQKKTKKTN